MGKTQIAQRKQRIEWLEKYMKSKGSENKKSYGAEYNLILASQEKLLWSILTF